MMHWQTTDTRRSIITSNQRQRHSEQRPCSDCCKRVSDSLQTCQPGNYTAIVHGVSNTTGVALVEVYDLN